MSRDVRRRHGRSSRLSSLVVFAAIALSFFAPFSFGGELVMHTITLSWASSPTPGVIGYRLYYGQQSRNYTNTIDVGNQISTEVANLIDGTTYYFAVTAYDASGMESLPSGEIHYTPSPAVLLNVSTRAVVETGDKVMIAGFLVGGIGQKKIVVRALGPSLSAAVTDALPDPVVSVYNGAQLIATNDDWGSGDAAALQALNLAPPNPLESAVVLTLKPGTYSVVVRGKNNNTGIALVEVYDAGPSP